MTTRRIVMSGDEQNNETPEPRKRGFGKGLVTLRAKRTTRSAKSSPKNLSTKQVPSEKRDTSVRVNAHKAPTTQEAVVERIDESLIDVLPPLVDNQQVAMDISVEPARQRISQRMSVNVTERILGSVQSFPVFGAEPTNQRGHSGDESVLMEDFDPEVNNDLLAIAEQQNQFNKKNIVFKGNQLVNATYSLPINFMRLILVAISKAGNQKILPGFFYRVTTEDLVKVGVPPTSVRSVMLDAFTNLRAETIDIIYRSVADGSEEQVSVPWVDTLKYNPTNRFIDVSFSIHLAPHISLLSSHYTSYCLEDIRYMRSSNAIRLYEMIAQYKFKSSGYWIISIEELMRRLTITTRYTPSMLRSRILDPSVEDINRTKKVSLSYDLKATNGRKFDMILFKWLARSTKQLPDESQSYDPLTKSQATHFAVLLHSDEAFRSEWGKGRFVSWNSLFPTLVDELSDPSKMSYFLPWLKKYNFDPKYKKNVRRKKKKNDQASNEPMLIDDLEVDPGYKY